MAPPEISKRVLDAKLEACRFAFSKLNAVRTTRMMNYKQLRTVLMMKEIARRGADRDFLKDPENSVTRILCAVLKQVASNSNRSLKALRGFRFDSLDDEQKEPVSRMVGSIEGMTKERYEAQPDVHLDDMSEPIDMEIYLGNEEDSVGGEMSAIVRSPISWPIEGRITVEWVESLMDLLNWFMWKNSVSELPLFMPHSVAYTLLETAFGILDKEDNCVKINCRDEGFRVIVVGDLRGHLKDLLRIFDDAGRPSENQCFVFNGNYIGRGSWSLEVFLVLIAWKILMPERVFLLRGNHETKVCAEEFGFCSELCDRFGEQGDILYTKCLDCFKALPLVSIIAESVYTTHGGLFRSIQAPQDQEKPQISLGSLEELSQIERKLIGESEDNSSVLGDVLWSSPWMSDGLVEINDIGRGVLWGHDCTESFLKQNGLKVIIRSHEGPDARVDREDMSNMLSGHSLDHEVESGKLYTLFSASIFSQDLKNYENEGAYAVLEPPDYNEPKFISFTVEDILKAVINNSFLPQQQQYTGRKSSNFDAIGISNPPTWTVPLSSDSSRILHLQEAPGVYEGFPLPDTVEEPHKSNYEYLFKLVGALKHEIKTKDDRERKLVDQLKKMKGTLDVIGKMTSSL